MKRETWTVYRLLTKIVQFGCNCHEVRRLLVGPDRHARLLSAVCCPLSPVHCCLQSAVCSHLLCAVGRQSLWLSKPVALAPGLAAQQRSWAPRPCQPCRYCLMLASSLRIGGWTWRLLGIHARPSRWHEPDAKVGSQMKEKAQQSTNESGMNYSTRVLKHKET